MAAVLKTAIRETVSKVRILPSPQKWYDTAMSDVLDLRKPSPAGEPAQSDEPVELEDPEEAELSEASNIPNLSSAVISWRAHHTLGSAARRRHYLLMGALGALGAGVAVWQASWLVLVTLLVCLATWELHERMAHPTAVSVDHRGVTVDGHFYPHASLSSFQVHRMPDRTHVVSIKTDSWTMPRLVLPLGDTDPFEVHTALSQHVPEGEHPVSFYDRWVRRD